MKHSNIDPMTIEMPAWENNCSQCGAEYENIGHPLKPGVIMMRLCKCVITIQSIPGGQITIISPPEKKDD